MTIRQTILGIICKLREVTGRRPVCDMRRVNMLRQEDCNITPEIARAGAYRICRRCGRIVAVKLRGPRKTKEAK